MENDKKYYWILYEIRYRTGGRVTGQSTTDKHPFMYINIQDKLCLAQKLPLDEIILLNWKEITKEEYELFKSLN